MTIPKKFQNIFITGGAGFIGCHLVDQLVTDGKKVIVFDNFSSGKREFLQESSKKKSLTIIKGDLLKASEVHKALADDTDIVFHLGANPDISKGFDNPSIDFNQTIVGTFNIVQEMRKKRIKNLVYFSGSGVYGDVGTTHTKESFGPLMPVSMYGASKLSAEALISAFSYLYGIRSWIFRPANIIGDRATHGVIYDFINKLKADSKELTILGNGLQSKSYVHVDDVVSAVFLAVQRTNDKVNIFNISSHTFITVNEIAKMVIDTMHLDHVKIVHTRGIGGWPGDIPVVRIDSKKLISLGWKPQYTSREAVKKTLKDLL